MNHQSFESPTDTLRQPRLVEQPIDPERPLLSNEEYISSLFKQIFPDRRLQATLQIRMLEMYLDFLIARTDEEVAFAIRRAKHDPAFTDGDQNHADIDTFAAHLLDSGLRQPPRLTELSTNAPEPLIETEFEDIISGKSLPVSAAPRPFPWLMEPSVDGRAPTAKINPDFYQRASQKAIELAYGKFRGEADLSPFGRMYLENIQSAFDRYIQNLISTSGEFSENVSVLGMPVEQYLEQAKEALDDPREYAFIASQVPKLYERIGKAWQKVVALDTAGVTITPDIMAPRHRTRKHWS